MGLEISDAEVWKMLKETHDASITNRTNIQDNRKTLKSMDGRLHRLEKKVGSEPRDAKYWSKVVGKVLALCTAITALVIGIMESFKKIGG